MENKRFWVLCQVAFGERMVCTNCRTQLYSGHYVYMTLDDATQSKVTGRYCKQCTPEIIREALDA